MNELILSLAVLFSTADPLEPTLGGQLLVIIVVVFFGLFIFKCMKL